MLSVLPSASLLAQEPLQQPLEIVRRAVEMDRRDTEISRNYTYLQRQEQRELDSDGKLKRTQSETFDITLLEGSPYRRQVAKDDHPLGPKEQRKEEEKLQHSIAERRKETKEQRERRIAEWTRRQEKQREPVKELPEAFEFKLRGEEPLNGGVAYVIDATPKPGYRPKSSATAFFPKVKLRLWINKQDYQWVRMDLETLDTISFGGVLVRMAKGSHLMVENARINQEVWLPKSAVLRGSVRIALVKMLRGEISFTFSDYKKFQAESRLVTQ